jgi:hypothetical protein
MCSINYVLVQAGSTIHYPGIIRITLLTEGDGNSESTMEGNKAHAMQKNSGRVINQAI